ncbi:MAG: type V CRISPR-associated protein Cas12b [Turneriella sp.]|nr:type V CRISPR-associated protein Cas12b [Turneriella sp.]
MQRSIKVKLNFQNPSDLAAIWFTHLHFHRGVRYYQELLLAMRGEDVHMRDARTKEPIESDKTNGVVWRAKLITYIEKARIANGNKAKLTAKECEVAIAFFKNFYDSLMLKDHEDYTDEPKGKLNVLTDSESEAGQGTAKGGRPDKALTAMRALFAKDKSLAKKYEIADSHEISKEQYGVLIQRLKREKSFAALEDLFEKHEVEVAKKKQKQTKGSIIPQLQQAGVLRIIPPYLEAASGGVKVAGAAPFEYGMWGVAVATLRSWNTWNEKAKKDKQAEEAKLEKINADVFADENKFPKSIRKILTKYEIDQHEAYAKVSDVKKQFRITRPMLRNWDALRKKWLKAQDESERKKQIAEWQQENRSYGDINLFHYLATEGNKSVWFENESFLYLWVRRNSILDQIDWRLGYAHLSLADEIYHPIWINNEAAESRGTVGSGSNKPGYALKWVEKKCHLLLRTLTQDENGISVISAPAEILPSYQWHQFKLAENGGGFIFTDFASGEPFAANPKGAKVMFERAALEKLGKSGKDLNKLTAADIPNCYFNCSWEVEGHEPTKVQKGFQISGGNEKSFIGWFVNQKEAKQAFASTSKKGGVDDNRDKQRDDLFRVMSVDMGLRSFAACSVFSVHDSKAKWSNKKFTVPLRSYLSDNETFQAVHERSFLLSLQGERTSEFIEAIRKAYRGKGQEQGIDFKSISSLKNGVTVDVFKEWQSAPTTAQMRQRINAMRILRRLNRDKSAEERENALADYIRRYQNAEYGWPFKSVSADELKGRLSKHFNSEEDWQAVLNTETENLAKQISVQFTEWRKAFRKKRFITLHWADNNSSKVGFAGNSLWNIEDLTDTRKLMLAWHNRAESAGDQKNLEKYSHFATDLLAHIQNLKDNRIKEGAHALIMVALGYEYVATNKDRAVLLSEVNGIRAASEKEIHTLLAKKQRPKFWQTGLGNASIKYGKWLQTYEPCDAIIFEDLSRFRFKSDRPRNENSMLMKWSHRAIPKETQMQGELYGIGIATVRAEFTSKFHAKTMAPGLRGRFFKPDELRVFGDSLKLLKTTYPKADDLFRNADYTLRGLLKSFSVNDLESIINASIKLERPCLLPFDGGEYFITLNEKHNPIYLNADINAAQSIARRWLNRYAEPVRVTGAYLRSKNEFIVGLGEKNKGNRVQRALGYGVLSLDTGSIDEYYFDTKWIPKEKQAWFKEYGDYLKGENTESREEIAEETDNQESAEDAEALEGKYSFFRDISGIVLDQQRWYSSKKFWSEVRRVISGKFKNPENLITK